MTLPKFSDADDLRAKARSSFNVPIRSCFPTRSKPGTSSNSASAADNKAATQCDCWICTAMAKVPPGMIDISFPDPSVTHGQIGSSKLEDMIEGYVSELFAHFKNQDLENSLMVESIGSKLAEGLASVSIQSRSIDHIISEAEQIQPSGSSVHPKQGKSKNKPAVSEDPFVQFLALLRCTIRVGDEQGPALAELPRHFKVSSSKEGRKRRRLLQEQLTKRLRQGDLTPELLIHLRSKTKEISLITGHLQKQQNAGSFVISSP